MINQAGAKFFIEQLVSNVIFLDFCTENLVPVGQEFGFQQVVIQISYDSTITTQ